MAEAKATPMLIKADLQCPRCYKKIKRLLCSFHEIRDQVFDEKQNTVTITVFCCSPERIRQKLICKGGKTIKSIEIIAPKSKAAPPQEKPKAEPEIPKSKPAADPKADKPAQKPQEKPKDMPAPVPVPVPIPVQAPAPSKPASPKKPAKPASEPASKPESAPKTKEAPPPDKPAESAPKPPQVKMADPGPVPMPMPMMPGPAPGYPPPVQIPVGYCCPQYYDGGFPCPEMAFYQGGGYGTPPPPPPMYESYGRTCQCGCGSRRYCSNRCDYFSEENPSACSIM